MLDLEELQQLVSFAEHKTLSRVAENLHISTPSVTRSMQHLEEEFGVTLFKRGKNKIELNENGEIAVEAAKELLQDAENVIRKVRDYDARQRTVVIYSCAPAPLWEMQREINMTMPEMMISSAICQNDEVLEAWESGSCDIAILPFESKTSRLYMKENLYVCIPSDHELAKHKSLSFADINGYNFLLRTNLGFWDTLCREKMPSSKFLIQSDESTFNELVKASSLPCFTTDYGNFRDIPGRINIPLTDVEAQVSFYVLARNSVEKRLCDLGKNL